MTLHRTIQLHLGIPDAFLAMLGGKAVPRQAQ